MSGTVILEWHSWRRPKSVGGELASILVMGFVSLTYCPFLMNDWLKAKLDSVRAALRPRHIVRTPEQIAREGQNP